MWIKSETNCWRSTLTFKGKIARKLSLIHEWILVLVLLLSSCFCRSLAVNVHINLLHWRDIFSFTFFVVSYFQGWKIQRNSLRLVNNSLSDLVFKQIDSSAVLLLMINQNLLLTKFDILNSSQNSCFMRILSFTFSSFVTSFHLACASFMSPKSSLWNTVEAILLLKAYFKKKVLEGRRPYS